ncbi:MAG TPA: toll/interleukin-1 receptor domain-containing protein [Vicinamibacterales bacterium]|nr:toll/interleukin-1 receptor domain-containing protein [Vicinamibacterales bacterium]
MSKARKAVRPRRRRQRAKVFISHATADRRRAQRIGRLLADSGVEYWFSREHLVHGEDWYRAIGGALGSCNWLVVVGSDAAIRNKWVRDEVTYALVERRYRNRIIPLLFEDCNLRRLAWSLQAIQYIDFRNGWQPGTDQLLKRLGKRPRRNVRR